ncbi:YuiA family protein [Alkalihalobacterium chitinilyticum]|uniref:YuiA family protein n=1 Tax=Alkalihalobacterium chitinilyticum TaxID=2980103 RepID=A0ABT5VKR9_9BACI|nr:YuiA family protein [Alkalihalobacterium chitinilyticum]MDE5415347.1 YuiA family protein [Alkalihalobacterium chitinilyticum]
MKKRQIVLKDGQCPYCNGTGYFELFLGGSETCDLCSGQGELNKQVEKSVVS